MTQHLTGVIAAAPTPVQNSLEPDLAAFALLCQWLMEQGCDGLNICGTTGEATSFSREQRGALMAAAAKAVSPARMMAGTGAAAIEDAVALTRHAAALGLAGAAAAAAALLLQGHRRRRRVALLRPDCDGDGIPTDRALSLSFPGFVRCPLFAGSGPQVAERIRRANPAD